MIPTRTPQPIAGFKLVQLGNLVLNLPQITTVVFVDDGALLDFAGGKQVILNAAQARALGEWLESWRDALFVWRVVRKGAEKDLSRAIGE